MSGKKDLTHKKCCFWKKGRPSRKEKKYTIMKKNFLYSLTEKLQSTMERRNFLGKKKVKRGPQLRACRESLPYLLKGRGKNL